MKLEAQLIVRGPVYNVPLVKVADLAESEPLAPDKVFFAGDIPGAMLFIGGRYVGKVIEMQVSGDVHLNTSPVYVEPEEFVGDEVTIRCILEF